MLLIQDTLDTRQNATCDTLVVYTLRKAAQDSGVPEYTLRYRVRTGQLRAFKRFGMYFLYEDDYQNLCTLQQLKQSLHTQQQAA